MTSEIIEKLAVWAFFGVALGLVPIVFDALRAMVRGGVPSFDDAVGRGELALVTAVICGSAVGELLGAGGGARLAKIIAGGCAVLILLASALFYTEASATGRGSTRIAKATVRNFSVILFLLGTLTSGCCVALSKVVSKEV